MLKIDENRLAANKLNGTKLKADPAVPGRFIYTVEADREAERNYGTNAIENIDNTTTISVNQNGERKTLPFITNSIVSAGDITISSNEKQVVYYSKTFRVTNRSITGTLRYATADGVKDVPAATSKTFLCLETGRTFYVANIANDPKGIDLGFTYYEGNDNKACLVSLDEYYKTGNYAMVVNDLNPEVIFKDATDLVTKESVFDEVDKASDLKDIFDQAKDYPTVLDYTAGKIAPALEEEDMIAFRTEDGRYGVMKVKEIDRKNEDTSNNQTISLDVVVEKN